MPRLDSVLRNPQTACQHKLITMHSGPADLKYKNVTTSVCVCVSVHILGMFHDLNTYCDTWCRIAHSRTHLPTCFKPQQNYLVFIGRKQHRAAFGAAHFSHKCENCCEICESRCPGATYTGKSSKATEQEISHAFHLALFLKMKITTALFQTQ